MIVTRKKFEAIVKLFTDPGGYGFDTETTGLKQSDRLFSIILADNLEGYYFNFNEEATDFPLEERLPREWIPRMQPIFDNPQSILYAQNAKFDIRMVENEGITIRTPIHCTYALGRVERNNHFSYELDAQLKRLGRAKDDAVKKYIMKNKLYDVKLVPGKKKLVQDMHFERVPRDIIVPYGCSDAVEVRNLGIHQVEKLNKLREDRGPDIWDLVENERRLTRTCATIEAHGIKVDRKYTQEALNYEQGKILELKRSFREQTGLDFVDGPTVLKKAFDAVGATYPRTAKGNPSFAKDALKSIDSPIAKVVKDIRTFDKRVGTYYSSFLYFADQNGILHANMKQAGTETGRFSYSDPNLQNIPKEDDDPNQPFYVRKCFVPRDDYYFFMIDFDQQEFRMMLDYAGEHRLIKEIMSGVDVHQATADLIGISRKFAKTINFGLLYGMGAAKLAAALGISVQEAKELRMLYFSRLPKVKIFLSKVRRVGETRGYIRNWFGRRCHISDPNHAYILPNHLIQGGCGDVVKIAMNLIDPLLAGTKSRMLVQVHDEILFEIHKSELHLVPQIKAIMESVYKPKNGLYLTCSVEHSLKSWGSFDKEKGMPQAA